MQDKKIRELVGIVVSDKTDKTITVLIETYKISPLYRKRVKHSSKYLVHDPKNEAKIGDKVKIALTRPISKNKHYRLIKIIEKAIII